MAAAQLFLCRKRALAALCLGLLHGEDEERPRKRNRKVYMQQWISRREERGVFHQLIRELEVGDVVVYKEFFRMTKEQFCFLLGKVSPLIQKKEQPTPINAVRASIQPDERLASTLCYLATGETYLEYSFRISRQTISSIVSETSGALYKVGSSYNRQIMYITGSKFTYLTYNLISYHAGTRSRIS